MLSRIKFRILRFLSVWHCLRLRRRGVDIAKGCMLLGKPRLRLAKGSSLVLEEDVNLISSKRFNPLLREAMNIRTLDASAEIILKAHCGLSGCSIVACNHVEIGEYTIVGPDTLIYDSEGHDYSPEIGWKGRSRRTGRPIKIGDKCFIGARCIILSGVTIGNNCVVAAGSVITQDIPDGHKASGNPAVALPLPKLLGGPGRKKAASPAKEG